MLRLIKSNSYIFYILLLAFSVRFLGIFHSLPFSYYGDEQHLINRAVSFGSGDLNPHWFHKPALYMYLLFFEYGAYFLIGILLGWFVTIDDFAGLYFTDASIFLIIGRMTNTLFGTATVYITYFLGKKHFGKDVGLTAALFLAFTLGSISSSQVVKEDVAAAFFSVLYLFFVLAIFERGRMRDYILAGLCAGLGAAVKYYPIILLPAMWLAHFLWHRRQHYRWHQSLIGRRFMMGLFCFVASFFLGSPYNFLDSFWFKQNLLPKLERIIIVSPPPTAVGTGNAPEGGLLSDKILPHIGLSPVLKKALISIKDIWVVIVDHSSMGPLLGMLALLGTLHGLLGGRPKEALLLAYVLSFIFLVSIYLPSYAEARHLNVLYPVLCLLAALFIGWIFAVLSARIRCVMPWKNLALGLLCGLLVVPAMVTAVRHIYLISQKDTRLLAKEWVEQHIPAGTKIVLDEEGPHLRMSSENLRELYLLARAEAPTGPFTTHLAKYYKYRMDAVQGITFDINEISHPWWRPKVPAEGVYKLQSSRDRDYGNPLKKYGAMPLEYYRQHGYQYVITNSLRNSRCFRASQLVQVPSQCRFYQDLFAQGVLVQEFLPHPRHRPGPTVKIFRLEPLPSTLEVLPAIQQ